MRVKVLVYTNLTKFRRSTMRIYPHLFSKFISQQKEKQAFTKTGYETIIRNGITADNNFFPRYQPVKATDFR